MKNDSIKYPFDKLADWDTMGLFNDVISSIMRLILMLTRLWGDLMLFLF